MSALAELADMGAVSIPPHVDDARKLLAKLDTAIPLAAERGLLNAHDQLVRYRGVIDGGDSLDVVLYRHAIRELCGWVEGRAHNA